MKFEAAAASVRSRGFHKQKQLQIWNDLAANIGQWTSNSQLTVNININIKKNRKGSTC